MRRRESLDPFNRREDTTGNPCISIRRVRPEPGRGSFMSTERITDPPPASPDGTQLLPDGGFQRSRDAGMEATSRSRCSSTMFGSRSPRRLRNRRSEPGEVVHQLPGRRQVSLELRPLRLVFRRRASYLMACSRRHGDVRIFKLGRIRKLTVTDRVFEASPAIDIEEFLDGAWDLMPEGKHYDVRITSIPKSPATLLGSNGIQPRRSTGTRWIHRVQRPRNRSGRNNLLDPGLWRPSGGHRTRGVAGTCSSDIGVDCSAVRSFMQAGGIAGGPPDGETQSSAPENEASRCRESSGSALAGPRIHDEVRGPPMSTGAPIDVLAQLPQLLT